MSSIPLGQNGGDDFPNPRGATYPLDGRFGATSPSPLTTTLLSLDQFFGAPGEPATNDDQPNPRGYTPSVDLRTGFNTSQSLSLLYSMFTVGGSRNLDQPNPPRGYTLPIDSKTWINQSAALTLLLGKDKFFGAAGMVPVNLDQPNPPRGYTPPITNRLHVVNSENQVILFGLDKFFGAAGQANLNADQPNPRGYQFPLDIRTLLGTLAQINTSSSQVTWQPLISQIWYSGTALGFTVSWGPMGVGATGAIDLAAVVQRFGAGDRSVQFAGTFGGATFNIQGSDDGINFSNLHDPVNNTISATSNGIFQIMEATQYLKPVQSGGAIGTTSVTVTLNLTVKR